MGRLLAGFESATKNDKSGKNNARPTRRALLRVL
jgi:hypothetical protein